METLKFKIQTIFAEQFTGHPSREDEDDIRKLKDACLIIAGAIDNIHANQTQKQWKQYLYVMSVDMNGKMIPIVSVRVVAILI